MRSLADKLRATNTVHAPGPGRRLRGPRRLGLLALLGLAAAGLVGFAIHRWPQRYLDAAHAALERHAYDEARTALLHYLEARPQSAEGHLLLAQLDRRSNRYADATDHLAACQRLGGPADAIELERALTAAQNGAFTPEVYQLCSEHLKQQGADEFLVLEALSQGLTKIYRLPEALACLDRMLVLQPDCNYALRRRAWIYAQRDDYDPAEADYRRALAIDAEDQVARLGLARILLDKRRNGTQAAEQFERLWAVQKDSAVAVGLAQSWQLLGRDADARRLLDDWLRDHPDDPLALAARGRLAVDEQALEQARTLLGRAVTLAPYLHDANYALYLCAKQQGQSALAEACQARMREAAEAHRQIAQLTQRLQAAPDDADLRCQIAQLFLRYGGEEEGVRWLLTILQNHPNHAPSRRALADYYAHRGKADKVTR